MGTATGWEEVLDEGERLLWQGRPRCGTRLTDLDPRDRPAALPLALALACGLALLLADVRFPALAAVLGLTGAAMVLGQLWLRTGWRRGLRYAVTDRRALVHEPGILRPALHQMPLDRCIYLQLTDDRCPTLVMSAKGYADPNDWFGGFHPRIGYLQYRTDPRMAFERLGPEAAGVRDLIAATRAGHRQEAP